MRSLSASLIANQKSLERPPLLKLVLTKSGQATQTFDISSTTNRIRNLNHIEQEWSQLAYISIQSDPTLAALSLEGYLGTISYGYNDAALSGGVWTLTDEFSACAPLEVMATKTSTLLNRSQVALITSFSLAGIFDLMSVEKAREKYTQEDTDTNTVKTLLTAIAQATLAPFRHYKAYTISFDSEDSLIDSYIPADYFYVVFGETRLSAFRKLLKTTKCKARIEGDGAIHIFNPTISGEAYDYEYTTAEGLTNHNFFEKSTRRRLVLPNRFIISSAPAHAVQWSGSAVDTATYTALGSRYIDEPHYIRAVSNAQCTAIATAMLQHRQIGAEKGHGSAPMNCGQEFGDYVKITDSIANDSRVGNIGYLRRQYTQGKNFSFAFRFGRVAGEMPFMTEVGEASPYATWEYVSEVEMWFYDQMDKLALWMIEQQEVMPKLHVTDQLIIPVKL